MGDNYLYEISKITEDLSEPFIKKEIDWVVDENKGAYNGTISFDCAKIANSGKWASWQEAILTIPFTIMMQSSEDITTTANSLMVGLRNGYYQLINNIQIDLNNTNCVQLTSYLNHYINYKILTTWSNKDVSKWGETLGVAKDTATSFKFSTDGSDLNGDGLSNNRTYNCENGSSQAGVGLALSDSNQGLFKRTKNILDFSTTGLTTADSFGGLLATAVGGPFITKSNALKMGKSVFYDDAGTAGARIYYVDMLATIRLKDLSDFIDKFPLTKGSYFKITIGYNSSRQTIFYDHAPTPLITANDLSITNGKTNPLIFTSSYTYNPNNVVMLNAGADTSFEVACNVGKVTDTTINSSHTNAILEACRITVPLYTMLKEYEDTYVSMNPTKEIVYKDIYQKYLSGKASSSTGWNEIISTGISEPLSVVVIPYLNSADNGTFAVSPIQSPFTTEGGTTSPLLSIKDFNVIVSGQNCFQQNISYDYDMFLQELRSINALNGGNSNGLCSGLIDQRDFEYAYRYYVADISRRLPLDDTPKTIQVMGTNETGKTVDYLVFVEFVRRLTIDIKSGAVVA